MNKKIRSKQNDGTPSFENPSEEELAAFLATHVIQNATPEDLCPCGEPISELGCGQVACDEEKPEEARFLPIPAFICKIKH